MQKYSIKIKRDVELTEVREHLHTYHKGDLNNPRYRKYLDWETYSVEHHLENSLRPLCQVEDLRGKKVLDFGCGSAASSIAVALQGAYVIGVEPNAKISEIGEIRVQKYGVQNRVYIKHIKDTRQLPFESESFDFVICNSVLEYITGNREDYLKEMWRLLKIGGLLYIGGTSNGIYPREVHHKVWFINYLPNFITRRRQKKGKGFTEIGITFWQIKKHLSNCYVENNLSTCDTIHNFWKRHVRKGETLFHRLKGAIVVWLLYLVQHSFCEVLNAPIEAFMSWMNLKFRKKGP